MVVVVVVSSCPNLAILWTVACQAPLSMGSLGKNTQVGCHFLLQGILPTQGLNPGFLGSIADKFFTN